MAFPTSIENPNYWGIPYNNLSTTLSQVAGISDTTIYAASTTNFDAIGEATCEDEIIYHTGKTAGSFTGCTRGYGNTTAAEHAAGKQVSLTFTATMWANIVAELRAALAKLGVDSSAVTTTHDYKLSGVTGTDKAASKTGIETLTNKTLASPLFTGTIDGWVEVTAGTYASATRITVPSGAASIYQKTDKLRWKQGAGYKYGYVLAVADTYLDLVPNTDFTVANSAITDMAYSHIENPLNFQQWLNWLPTYTCTGSMTFGTVTTTFCKFKITGGTIHVILMATGTTGGTASTSIIASMPVTCVDAVNTACSIIDGTAFLGFVGADAARLLFSRFDNAVWGLGATRRIYSDIFYTF